MKALAGVCVLCKCWSEVGGVWLGEGRGKDTFIRSRRRDLGTDIFGGGGGRCKGMGELEVENVGAVDGALVVSPVGYFSSVSTSNEHK